jgi:hypothetical protein
MNSDARTLLQEVLKEGLNETKGELKEIRFELKEVGKEVQEVKLQNALIIKNISSVEEVVDDTVGKVKILFESFVFGKRIKKIVLGTFGLFISIYPIVWMTFKK